MTLPPSTLPAPTVLETAKLLPAACHEVSPPGNRRKASGYVSLMFSIRLWGSLLAARRPYNCNIRHCVWGVTGHYN